MRSRRAKLVALAAVTALAVATAGIGGTFGAFAGETSAAANSITAMPDFRGPTVSALTIGKNAGGITDFIGSNRAYRIYANVTDVGTPPSGVSSVVADVSGLTTGQTNVTLTAGAYTAGGQSFNYRSAVLTASAGLPAGPMPFTVTATDVALNATVANGSVTVDNTAPSAIDLQATGGTTGRAQIGDVLTLTFSEAMEPNSLLPGWGGSAVTTEVRFRQNTAADRVEIHDAGRANQVATGTISLGRTDYVTADAWFTGSTMTMSGSTLTVVLGGPLTGATTTAAGNGTMVWSPVNTALDRAGNPMSTTARNETGTADRDF